jgi:hypothetical protein
VTWTAADTSLISELIDQVTDWVEDYTHRKLVAVSSTTYTFDTVAGWSLHVPIGIRTITLLEVAATSQPDSGGTYVTVAATDYILRPKVQEAGIGWPFTELRFARSTLAGTLSRFRDADNGARITGTFGFATTPPAIQAVTIDAVVTAWQNRKAGASGTLGADGSALIPWDEYFTARSPQRAALDRYRYFAV